jgi:polyisoprenoid-binding protein YceI
MLRNVFLCATAMLLVLAVAGCTDPTSDVPEATLIEPDPAGTEATPPPAPVTADRTTYVMTQDTGVAFAGSKMTGTHYGQFPKFEGSVVLEGDDLTTAQIDIAFDMTALDTDNTVLTNVLRGADFFDVEQYPDARFTSTKVEATDEGHTITGNLTMHGVTKALAFPAEVELDGNTITGFAEFSINRKDWGLQTDTYKGDTIIREGVLLTLDVVAEKDAEG